MKDSDSAVFGNDRATPLLWAAVYTLLLWTRIESPWALVGAAGLTVWAGTRLGPGVRVRLPLVLLLATVAMGLYTDALDRRFVHGWDEYWGQREADVAEQLATEFDMLVNRGDGAVERVVDVAAMDLDRAATRDSLTSVLEDVGMAAVAVFGVDGRLTAWAGSHHGRVPDAALDGLSRYAFSETPLFSYMYFTAEIPDGGGTALVASLMRSDLPESFATGLGDFASRFQSRAGERIRISRAERVAGTGVFDFGWPDETLLSIAVVPPSRSERRIEHRSRWTARVLALCVIIWLLLSYRAPASRLPYSLAALGLAAGLVPVDHLRPPQDMVDPAAFLLPGPLPITLGRMVLLLGAAIPLVALMAVRTEKTWRSWVVPLAIGLLFPLGFLWFSEAISVELIGTTDGRWIVFQFGLTLALAIVSAALLTAHRSIESPGVPGLVVLGLFVAAGLGLTIAAGVRTGPHVPPVLTALWAVPAFFMVRGLRGRWHRLSYIHWFCAFWLAGTAVLPIAWSMRTEARMGIAEEQLGRLGMAADPYLDFLLDRFAAKVDSLARAGASHVELLYQSWSASGLGEEGSPIFLTLWSPGDIPEQELRLGVSGDRPPIVAQLLPTLRTSGASEHRRLELVDAHHLVSVPLEDGRLVTGVIPPRRTITAPSALGPLFVSVEGSDQEFLTLIRALEGDDIPESREVTWSRNAEGWRGERIVDFPDQPHSVFYTISTPTFSVMFARGTLLLALSMGVGSILWLLSVGVLAGGLSIPIDWRGLFTSFRARVTWTLFGFFVLSNVIFGTLAYRTLSGASERTATALAERVVGQIAETYLEEGGSMELLARRVGADLLEYRDGELVGGSVDELIDLGLYDAWVDPEIYEALEGREQLRESTVASLGDWRYVLAYRRLPDGDIVASPVPLRAGAAALRRRDVADLLGFATVLGPILSLGLALLVGRALTRPIQTLQIASERVGSGNLAVHLPEDRVDEFGSVFDAFNRMVLRLGDARRELLQTTRRTEAIVEEAATGVIALDRERRVTIVNPRAELLLATSIQEGAPVPRAGPFSTELADWLEEYYGSGQGESDADFEWGDRRVRGRARRIAREGRVGGVVVNLEDVTDELRSERILAWGEMAKQVAHEVKNPLTPIKLSVQHLLRAWDDKRTDFGEILGNNVRAILGEIDRLASIARSFSRFAAPGAVGESPVTSVDAAQVIREVLDLYGGGGDTPVRLEGDFQAGLPPVASRPDELKEVLLNLLENSRAAMPEGGCIRIGAQRATEPGGGVVITVEDDGTGIPAQLLPRIFEPQFSTRSTGTGLGLAIVKRLVDSWGGSIEVDSEDGKGTRVRIHLDAGDAGAPLGDPGAGR